MHGIVHIIPPMLPMRRRVVVDSLSPGKVRGDL